jgi:hypothetical protein
MLPSPAETVIPLTITQSSSQYPGTLGTGSGSPNCPNTTISISVSFSVTLPSQYGSIAQALADGYEFNDYGVGTGHAVSYHNGDQCQVSSSSVGPETYNVWFSRNNLGLLGIPTNIGIGTVTPGAWTVSPTTITYSGPYFQQMGGPQVGTIAFTINGNIGGGLAITNISPMPAAVSGKPYSSKLIASGGIPPYSWSIGEPLPAGFLLDSLSGVITSTGSPSATPDTYHLTVHVFDHAGANVTKNLDLIVNCGEDVLQSLDLSPTSVIGGVQSQGTITLKSAAPISAGFQASLKAETVWTLLDINAPTIATVPMNASIAGGAMTASFGIDTSPVLYPLKANISAKVCGSTKTAKLTVQPKVIPSVGAAADARVEAILVQVLATGSYDKALDDIIQLRNSDPQLTQDIYLAAADHYLFALNWVREHPSQVLLVAGLVPTYEILKIASDLSTSGQPTSPATVLSVEWGERGVADGVRIVFGRDAVHGRGGPFEPGPAVLP